MNQEILETQFLLNVDECQHEWNTDIMLCSNPPQYRCKKCDQTIYVHAYNLLKLVGK